MRPLHETDVFFAGSLPVTAGVLPALPSQTVKKREIRSNSLLRESGGKVWHLIFY